MIECKDCALPTLPPVLFWEGLFNVRLPCVCGCTQRVRNGQPQAIDFDVYAQMRAADDGMSEAGVVPVPVIRWELAGARDQTPEFMNWLLTRDGKMLSDEAANAVTMAVVTKLFRPARLQGVFQASGGLAVTQGHKVFTPDENPYMSGMTALAKVF